MILDDFERESYKIALLKVSFNTLSERQRL